METYSINELLAFAKVLNSQLDPELYDQDIFCIEQALTQERVTCGCLCHHLTRAIGDHMGLVRLARLMGLHPDLTEYIAGDTSAIKAIAEEYGYPISESFGTSELVERIGYVLDMVAWKDDVLKGKL